MRLQFLCLLQPRTLINFAGIVRRADVILRAFKLPPADRPDFFRNPSSCLEATFLEPTDVVALVTNTGRLERDWRQHAFTFGFLTRPASRLRRYACLAAGSVS